jgi:hypothetical protein
MVLSQMLLRDFPHELVKELQTSVPMGSAVFVFGPDWNRFTSSGF